MNDAPEKLVDAKGLLEALFPPESRPTVRYVRTLTERREIPFVKLGRLVFFDPARVRQVLTERAEAKLRK